MWLHNPHNPQHAYLFRSCTHLPCPFPCPLRHKSHHTLQQRRCAETTEPHETTVTTDHLLARRRVRVCEELATAGTRAGLRATTTDMEQGWSTLELLVPGFAVNLELLKASEWAGILLNTNEVASKLILVKSTFPGLDVPSLLAKYPRVLLRNAEELQRQLAEVAELLSEARDPGALISHLPQLLEPKSAISILVTVQRWYPKKQPIAVLEADPDLIRRAQENDIPLEPVFFDSSTGSYAAPQHNRTVTQEWQRWVRVNVYKAKDVQMQASQVQPSSGGVHKRMEEHGDGVKE